MSPEWGKGKPCEGSGAGRDESISKVSSVLSTSTCKMNNHLLTHCIRESHKRVLLQTLKTQMKCHILQHFIRVYTVKVKKIF